MQDSNIHELIRLAPMMASNVIHKINVANSGMDLLISDNSISPDVREKLSLLKAQINHAAALATQFLTITQSELQLETLNLQEIISELAPLLQILLGKGVELQTELELDLGPIKVATDQFEDVFCILAVNARHAMPNGGTLRIRARSVADPTGKGGSKKTTSADYVSIEIEDTGVGIPELDLDRIFEPFFTTKGPGCGLGLATVYSIIKNANGQITAKSKVGKGTTFSILLPRHLPLGSKEHGDLGPAATGNRSG